MPRKLRHIPEGGALVEITCRTAGAQHLLRPDPVVNELVIGIVGRAQRLHDMTLCSMVFMSTHFHLLLFARDVGQLAAFMAFVNANISKEIGAHIGRKGPFWARRYDAILVSDEERAQVDRLVYQLRHGVKEGLVERPEHWPGAQAAAGWLEDGPLVGYWFDRSKEGAARRRGKTFDRLAYATRETVHFSPLPCWQHRGLSRAQVRREIVGWIDQIAEEAAAERRQTRKRVLGLPKVLRQRREAVSPTVEYRPAPLFHAATRQALEDLRDAYRIFAQAYHRASADYRAGEKDVIFPDGCFPPALPFYPGPTRQLTG